jgi:putative endonuclease
MAKHNEIGRVGEKVAEEYLISKGHTILSRNYRKPYGEIDIVSKKGNLVRFVEVKSVSWETGKAASEEGYRPEENVHPAKVKRMIRVIDTYIREKNIESEWQFDVIAVYLDEKTKTAKVRFLENIILGT